MKQQQKLTKNKKECDTKYTSKDVVNKLENMNNEREKWIKVDE